MSLPVDIHEVSRRLAVLEERMNTRQAEYRSDLAELMKQIADRNAEMNAEISKWSKGVASRDVVNTRWTIATIIGVAVLGFGSMGFILAQRTVPAPQPVFIPVPVQQPAVPVVSGQVAQTAGSAAQPDAPADPAANA